MQSQTPAPMTKMDDFLTDLTVLQPIKKQLRSNQDMSNSIVQMGCGMANVPGWPTIYVLGFSFLEIL
jgi:hypothetical protein